jgi:octaprenyl-diphosphate synthase
MISLNEIKMPIKRQMDEFEVKFKESMKSSVPLLDIITKYIVKRKGKQIRPMFVFFSADICGGINESTFRAASLIELLHTATLVHDDVVDDSNERRGFFSINALWKNKIAVLVGDFLLSRGLLLAVDNQDFGLLKIVSDSVREMSEGELLQIEKARNLDIKEPIYYEIIKKKTATLIASCCACGAASAGADSETVKKMYEIGENIGIAFQIKDDLLDFEGTRATGKPTGVDIKEQKLTLPLIYLLNNVSSSEKRKIINIVKNHHNDLDKVSLVIKKVNQSGGMEYAAEKMNDFQQKAIKGLESFGNVPSARSLKDLILYTTERNK